MSLSPGEGGPAPPCTFVSPSRPPPSAFKDPAPVQSFLPPALPLPKASSSTAAPRCPATPSCGTADPDSERPVSLSNEQLTQNRKAGFPVPHLPALFFPLPMSPHFLSSPRAAPLQALFVRLLRYTADRSPAPCLLGQVPPDYAAAAAALPAPARPSHRPRPQAAG